MEETCYYQLTRQLKNLWEEVQLSQEDVLHEPGSLQVRGQESGPALVQQDGQDGLAQVGPVQLRAQGRHVGPDIHRRAAVLQDRLLQTP